MGEFDLTTRIRRCRSVSGTSDNGYARQASELCESNASSERRDITFAEDISARLRRVVLDADLFCRMCGVVPGDIDDVTGRQVEFHIGRIENTNLDGKDEVSNLKVLCSTCYRGAIELKGKQPSAIWLLSQVRQAEQDEQRTLLAALLKKFWEEK